MMKTDAIEKIKALLNPKYDVLHLPIKGVWFKMIASGVKKEEYRDVKRRYISLLTNVKELSVHQLGSNPSGFKDLKILHLTAGYGDHRPQLWAEIESITIGTGNPDWGAELGKDYFVIKIGKITHTKNFVLQSQPYSGTNV